MTLLPGAVQSAAGAEEPRVYVLRP